MAIKYKVICKYTHFKLVIHLCKTAPAIASVQRPASFLPSKVFQGKYRFE